RESAHLRSVRAGASDEDELVRSRIRKRAQEGRVDGAEDGRVRADAEAEREHGDEGESGPPRQGAQAEEKISAESVHAGSPCEGHACLGPRNQTPISPPYGRSWDRESRKRTPSRRPPLRHCQKSKAAPMTSQPRT